MTTLLALYDAQLRGASEFDAGMRVDRLGPLYLGIFPGGTRGFATYQALGDASIPALAREVIDYFAARGCTEFEWKTRGHDQPANLLDQLRALGFVPEERETVMAGDIEGIIAADAALPAGFAVRKAETEAELRAADACATEVFGGRSHADALVARLQAAPESFEMWFVTDPAGDIVCSGRVDFEDGTDFGTIWGGNCRAEYRGRGLYRALTAARARSAQARGEALPAVRLHGVLAAHSRARGTGDHHDVDAGGLPVLDSSRTPSSNTLDFRTYSE